MNVDDVGVQIERVRPDVDDGVLLDAPLECTRGDGEPRGPPRILEGVDDQAGVELKAGATFEKSTENTRLVAARTRGIDGRWRSRDECVQEARK